MLKDKLREKESELAALFDACEAEKNAYEAARESADERFRSEQERKAELESTVRELTVLVEQLRQVCCGMSTVWFYAMLVLTHFFTILSIMLYSVLLLGRFSFCLNCICCHARGNLLVT
jgi:hypothetical protein